MFLSQNDINDSEQYMTVKEALEKIFMEESEKEWAEIEKLPEAEFSRRHKIWSNRLFREIVRSDKIPYPEADHFLERLRSKLVVKLRLEKFFWRKYR